MHEEQLAAHFIWQRLTPVVPHIGNKQAQRCKASVEVTWDVSLEQSVVGTWCWVVKQEAQGAC